LAELAELEARGCARCLPCGAKCKCRSFDCGRCATFAPHDIGSDGFVVSHLSDKNKDVAKVGHPESVVAACDSDCS